MCDAVTIDSLLKRVADAERERDEAYAERDLYIRAADLLEQEVEKLSMMLTALRT